MENMVQTTNDASLFVIHLLLTLGVVLLIGSARIFHEGPIRTSSHFLYLDIVRFPFHTLYYRNVSSQ